MSYILKSVATGKLSVQSPIDKYPHSRLVFVGGLHPAVDSNSLRTFFENIGPLDFAEVMRSPNMKSKGFGYVQFEHQEDAVKTTSLKGLEIYNKFLTIEPAIDPRTRVQFHKSRTERKVFVGGLPKSVTPEQLLLTLSQFGHVEKMSKFKNKAKEFIYCYVLMGSLQAAHRLISMQRLHIEKHGLIFIKPFYTSHQTVVQEQPDRRNLRKPSGVPVQSKAQQEDVHQKLKIVCKQQNQDSRGSSHQVADPSQARKGGVSAAHHTANSDSHPVVYDWISWTSLASPTFKGLSQPKEEHTHPKYVSTQETSSPSTRS